MEINNQDEQSSNQPSEQKKTNGGFKFFPVAASLVLVIFVSSTFGAVFGFLASRTGSQLLFNLKAGNFAGLISPSVSENPIERRNTIQEDSAVIDVVKKTTPSVVSIAITKDVPTFRNFGGFPDFFDFFNQQNEGNGSQKQTVGGGTGFFISNDGMLITNRHVVEDSSASYTVITNDNKELPAKILAVDPVNDIAVIKVDGTDFPVLNLGDSDSVQIGQTVLAIGNSLGQFSNTVSRGIISGLQRNVTAGGSAGQTERLSNIIQTDAAINPGNSGGPLLDLDGSVIGLNVAIAQGAQNIGFAIPVNQVKRVADQVKATGKISTPYIGVRYIPIDENLQQSNGIPFDYGNLVVRGDRVTDFAVIPGSPADKAGIVENDIILEVNGDRIDDENGKSLSDLISRYKVGDTITLKVWHKGETKDLKVILEERKS